MAIAFYDLDKTLLDVNSARLWIKRQVREKRIKKIDAMRAAWSMLQYELGRVDIEDLIEKAVGHLAGLSEQDIADRTQAFFDEELKDAFRKGAYISLQKHKEAGDLCVLLTGSSLYLAQATQKHLQLDDILCNRFVTEAGTFTGRAITPICYAEGKVHHAQQCAEKFGFELSECTFYSDSFSDLPALLACGKGVAISPDPRLKRAIAKHDLAFEDWGTRA